MLLVWPWRQNAHATRTPLATGQRAHLHVHRSNLNRGICTGRQQQAEVYESHSNPRRYTPSAYKFCCTRSSLVCADSLVVLKLHNGWNFYLLCKAPISTFGATYPRLL